MMFNALTDTKIMTFFAFLFDLDISLRAGLKMRVGKWNFFCKK